MRLAGLLSRHHQRVGRQLLTALVDYTLSTAIEGHTLITDLSLSPHVAAVGWRCEMLSHSRVAGGAGIEASRVHIDTHTMADPRRTGADVAASLTFTRTAVAA